MTLPISIIVAVAANGVIGKDGDMPWKLSSDLKRFRAITTGNPIIMGRKTYESIGRPLPNRHNIVVTRSKNYAPLGIVVVSSTEQALEVGQEWGAQNSAKEICILGGGEIYQQFLPIATRLYYTKVLASPDGDTRFPEVDETVWKLDSEEFVPSGPKDTSDTRFIVFERR